MQKLSKLSAFSATIGLISSLVFSSVPALAAAPTGTLTSTTTTVPVGATATVNTLTITDGFAEITSGTILVIRIPSFLPVKFDVSVTAPAFGGKAAGKVAPDVMYSDPLTLNIAVFADFIPGDTLTIDGLKLMDGLYAAGPTPFEWSVDSGATFASSAAPIEIMANALNFVTVLPESSVVNSVGDLFISFTTTNPIPADGSIEVQYPTANDLTGGFASCPGLDGAIVLLGGNGPWLVLARAADGEGNMPTEAPAGTYSCRLVGVQNIGVTGDSGAIVVATRDTDGNYLDSGLAPSVVFDTVGALTGVGAQLSPAYTGETSTAVVSFTLQHPFPPNGIVAVTFPAEFAVRGANAVACTSDDITGTFALGLMGQTVLISREGAGFATAPMTCTIPGILNPSVSGPVGTLGIETWTSMRFAIDSGVSPELAVGPRPTEDPGFGFKDPTPPGVVSNVTITNVGNGTSLQLNWNNPNDSDFKETVVYRSLVAGTLETMVAATNGTSFTDTGLTAGQTYFYTFQPKDSAGNTQSDTTQYAGTSSLGATPAQGLFSEASNTTGATGATTPATPPSGTTPISLSALTLDGSLVKGLGNAVYLVNKDGRFLFPNEPTYFSWFANFNGVQTVDDAVLGNTPLVGNMTVRPGTYLVKSPTDAKVYAVEPGNTLRWIPNEEAANALYGTGWDTRVATLSSSLLNDDYTEGSALTALDVPVGTLLADATGFGLVTAPGFVQPVSTDALAAANLQTSFAVSVPSTLAFAVGAPITTPVSTVAGF